MVLLEIDLFGLVGGGAPDDEYDSIIPDLYSYAVDSFWDDQNAAENLKRKWDSHYGLEAPIERYIELFRRIKKIL